NSARIDAINDSIIRIIVCDSLYKGAQIIVTGYDDGILSERQSLVLSRQRALVIVDAIKRYAKAKTISTLEGQGVGGLAPLYKNDLPEGRCFNRTVQVIISTPWD